MKAKTYSEKLKDPRWQKKRLEILSRDDWRCVLCGDDKNTLHVHHTKYFRNPWDVQSRYLHTLCEPCHEMIEYAVLITREARPKRKFHLFRLAWFLSEALGRIDTEDQRSKWQLDLLMWTQSKFWPQRLIHFNPNATPLLTAKNHA